MKLDFKIPAMYVENYIFWGQLRVLLMQGQDIFFYKK